MFCDQCGKQLPEQAKFCPSCGAPCASVPEVPEITPKADAASAAAQADAQNTFVPAAETDAKTAQPSNEPRRKQKKSREKGGKTQLPAWFKRHRRLSKILLCVALVMMLLVVIDFLRSNVKPECPDPFAFFGLSEDADTYTYYNNYRYPSTMDEQTALAAISSYTDLVRNEYDGTVLYCLDHIEVYFYNHSLLFRDSRRMTIGFVADENRWHISYSRSCDKDDFKFVPVAPYQAATTGGDTTEQQDTAPVPDASSDAAENETTAPTEPEVVEKPVLEGAVVPDFSAFCNGNVYEYRVTEDTDNTEYVYFWCYNGKARAEYIELLEDYNLCCVPHLKTMAMINMPLIMSVMMVM